MRLYIVRHGDPDYDHDTITPEGHLEAQALAERFAEIGLDKIYTSPMGRAIATMKYTADKLKLSYEVENWTHEIGELWLNETPWGPLASWDIPGDLFRGAPLSEKFGDWDMEKTLEKAGVREVMRELRKNSDAFLKRLGYEREGSFYRPVHPNEQKVAVFCHGGFGLTWLSCLLEIPLKNVWGSFWLPPTSVTTILFDQRQDDRATPRCIGMGDVSHLYKAGLPVRPRGIKANFY